MGEAGALGLPVVLLIEDDPDLGPLIRDGLVRSGFAVELASTLEAALRRLGREPMPELIVLDLSLPDADGLEALRVLRALPLPGDPPSILVLTVYRDPKLRVEALEGGADDFMTKPFQSEELVARLRALLRRRIGRIRMPRSVGPLELDPRLRTVRWGDRCAMLSFSEWIILWRLAARPGIWIPIKELAEAGPEDPVFLSEGAVRVLIHRLRHRLREAFGDRVQIESARGAGYRLILRSG